MREPPFKPRNLDEDIANRSIFGGMYMEDCHNAYLDNIHVHNANFGLNFKNSDFILDNYCAIGTKKPLRIRGGERADLRRLWLQRYSRN